MDFKDYYEILGVASTAEKKVIQQTFFQLASKHHPDVNPGKKDAEEKFKTINEAYQVLSDEKQRKKYDELRVQYQHWQKTGGQQQQDFDWQSWSAESGKGARINMPTPKTWKTSSEAHRPTPISSQLFLAEAEPAAPARAVDGMLNMKLI